MAQQPLTLLQVKYTVDARGQRIDIERVRIADLDRSKDLLEMATLHENLVREIMGRPSTQGAAVGSIRVPSLEAEVNRIGDAIVQFGPDNKLELSNDLRQELLPNLHKLSDGNELQFTWTWDGASRGRGARYTFCSKLVSRGSSVAAEKAFIPTNVDQFRGPTTGEGRKRVEGPALSGTERAAAPSQEASPAIVRIDYTKHPNGTWDIRTQYLVDLAAVLPDRRRNSDWFDTDVRRVLRLLIPGTPLSGVNNETFTGQGRTVDMLARHISWFEQDLEQGKDNRTLFSERERFVQFLYDKLMCDVTEPQSVRAYFRYDGIKDGLGVCLRFDVWEEVSGVSTRRGAGETAEIQKDAKEQKPTRRGAGVTGEPGAEAAAEVVVPQQLTPAQKLQENRAIAAIQAAIDKVRNLQGDIDRFESGRAARASRHNRERDQVADNAPGMKTFRDAAKRRHAGLVRQETDYVNRLEALRSNAGIQGLQAFGSWLLGDALYELPDAPEFDGAPVTDEEAERQLFRLVGNAAPATDTTPRVEDGEEARASVDPWEASRLLSDEATLEDLHTVLAGWKPLEEAARAGAAEATGPEGAHASRHPDPYVWAVFGQVLLALDGADEELQGEITRLLERWLPRHGHALILPKKRGTFDPQQHEVIEVTAAPDVPRDSIVACVKCGVKRVEPEHVQVRAKVVVAS